MQADVGQVTKQVAAFRNASERDDFMRPFVLFCEDVFSGLHR